MTLSERAASARPEDFDHAVARIARRRALMFFAKQTVLIAALIIVLALHDGKF